MLYYHDSSNVFFVITGTTVLLVHMVYRPNFTTRNGGNRQTAKGDDIESIYQTEAQFRTRAKSGDESLM